MDAQLEVKLIDCLDALAQGQPMEQVLARYPADAAQLRPLLETAQALPAFRMQPSEAAKIKSRQNFLDQADRLRRTTPRKGMGFLPRFVAGLAAAAIIVVVLGSGAVAASGSALPGDPLYSLKRTIENVQLSTAASASAHQELQQEFDQRRRDEANTLLGAGRESEVIFSGPIEDLQPGAWIVGGLVVRVDANTQIVGTPQLDQVAEVHGMTGPNGLRATAITIASHPEVKPTPTLPVQPTPPATATPEPTQTPTATAAPQAKPTSVTVTPRPRPTNTPSPAATPEAVTVEFEGAVGALGTDRWTIDGVVVEVNTNTEIHGSINAGQRVKVQALRQPDGRLIATSIEPVESGGGQTGSPTSPNTNENQNFNTNQNSNNNDNGNDSGGNHNSNDNSTNSNDGENNHNSNDHSNGNSNEDNHNSNGNDNANSNESQVNVNSNDH